jgi:hypothetical protein
MKAGFLVLALAAAAACSFGQASDHERLGVESEPQHRIEGTLGASWRADGRDWSSAMDASIEYGWKQILGFCLSMPAELVYSAGLDAGAWSWRLGDPSLSASRLWRGKRLKLRAELGYAYPLPRKEQREAHVFSPSLSLAGIRDPVVISMGIDGRISLPRKEGGYLVWAPFSGGLCLSAWELLNDRVGYRISISPGVSLGARRIGFGDRINPLWSLGLSLTLSWDEKAWGIQSGWNGSAESSGDGLSGAMSLRGGLRKEW